MGVVLPVMVTRYDAAPKVSEPSETLPVSATLPLDPPFCSVSEPAPVMAPVMLTVPVVVRIVREFAATASEPADTLPVPVLMLLAPAMLSAPKVAGELLVLNVPFTEVTDAVLVRLPGKYSAAPILPSVTPPEFSKVTPLVTRVLPPRKSRLSLRSMGVKAVS